MITYTLDSIDNRSNATLQRQCRQLEFICGVGRNAEQATLLVDEVWQIDGTWGVSFTMQRQARDLYGFGSGQPVAQVRTSPEYEVVAIGQTGWAEGKQLHIVSSELTQIDFAHDERGLQRLTICQRQRDLPLIAPDGFIPLFNSGPTWDRPRVPSSPEPEPPSPNKIFEGFTPPRDPSLPRRRLTLTE
jgi:hypothetical protein